MKKAKTIFPLGFQGNVEKPKQNFTLSQPTKNKEL